MHAASIAHHFHKLSPQADRLLKVLEELTRADEHTLVKHLRKSNPCFCLDEKYIEVKYKNGPLLQ